MEQELMNNSSMLVKALEDHGGTDIEISYKDVAYIFPSSNPHPDSFGYKSIDNEALLEWGNANDWVITKLTEKAPIDAKQSPPLRFTKK